MSGSPGRAPLTSACSDKAAVCHRLPPRTPDEAGHVWPRACTLTYTPSPAKADSRFMTYASLDAGTAVAGSLVPRGASGTAIGAIRAPPGRP